MRRVLLIDNYDSFTYNLVQALLVAGAEVVVHRNDQISVEAAVASDPTHLMISPGPGRPEGAGISLAVLEALMPRVPTLGVCLGHQALGTLLGGRVESAQTLMHGKASPVHHDGRGVFSGLPQPFQAGRYHSLALRRDSLPPEVAVTAWTDDGEVMGIRHPSLPVEGVQFHPESVLTPDGDQLLRNFLEGS